MIMGGTYIKVGGGWSSFILPFESVVTSITVQENMDATIYYMHPEPMDASGEWVPCEKWMISSCDVAGESPEWMDHDIQVIGASMSLGQSYWIYRIGRTMARLTNSEVPGEPNLEEAPWNPTYLVPEPPL